MCHCLSLSLSSHFPDMQKIIIIFLKKRAYCEYFIFTVQWCKSNLVPLSSSASQATNLPKQWIRKQGRNILVSVATLWGDIYKSVSGHEFTYIFRYPNSIRTYFTLVIKPRLSSWVTYKHLQNKLICSEKYSSTNIQYFFPYTILVTIYVHTTQSYVLKSTITLYSYVVQIFNWFTSVPVHYRHWFATMYEL